MHSIQSPHRRTVECQTFDLYILRFFVFAFFTCIMAHSIRLFSITTCPNFDLAGCFVMALMMFCFMMFHFSFTAFFPIVPSPNCSMSNIRLVFSTILCFYTFLFHYGSFLSPFFYYN